MIAPSVSPHHPPTSASLVGLSLAGGRYRVVSELGAGGMGEVYRARDERLKRDVAVKRLAPDLRRDPEAGARFLREVRRTSRLDDPHLAVVHDVLEERGEVYLVLELIHGQTLRARAQSGLPALDEFISIAIQSSRALAAAHAQGIIHCDLKPENIMVTPNGHVKVLDFGLALAMPRGAGSDNLTMESPSAPSPPGENAGAGTASYMSPEALRGEPCDERSDLFSLGVVLYETWTGTHPFRGTNPFLTSDHILHDSAVPAAAVRPETPLELDALFERLLAKDRASRPTSADEARKALQLIAHGRPGVIDPHPTPVGPARGRLLAPVSSILLVALASTGATLALAPRSRHALARTLGVEKALPERRLVAILPFTVSGGDSTTRALADGLTYTLASQLTRVQPLASSLQVAPMSEVHLENIHSARDAHRRLGATLTVEGNVQQFASGLRVTCSLVDAVAGVQLRSLSIDNPPTGPELVQDRVAQSVAEMLELDDRARAKVATRRPRRMVEAANALYLGGRGLLPDYDDPARLERARRRFEGAIALDSTFAPAWAGLGESVWRLYADSKDPALVDRARSAFETALRLDPQLPEAHVGLGQVQSGSGFPEIGAREFQSAIALDATSDEAYRGLATVYQAMGRESEAEDAYREAIARHPDYWGGYSWLGTFYLRAARYPEALAMFRRITELAPDNSRGWRNLGSVLSYMDRESEAIEALRHSIRLRPDYVAYNNLAALLFYDGRNREAAEAYRKALALNDRDYRVWGNLADCQRHLRGGEAEAGRLYREATSRAERALETNPRDATALACLAEYRANLGQAIEAARRLEDALRIRPDDPELNFYGVVVCERLGDRAGAVKYFRKSLAEGYSLVEFQNNPDLADFRRDPRVREALAGRG